MATAGHVRIWTLPACWFYDAFAATMTMGGSGMDHVKWERVEVVKRACLSDDVTARVALWPCAAAEVSGAA